MKKIYIVTDEDGEELAFGSKRSAESYLIRHPESIDTEIRSVPYFETFTSYQEEE